jgi:hypothetical protein
MHKKRPNSLTGGVVSNLVSFHLSLFSTNASSEIHLPRPETEGSNDCAGLCDSSETIGILLRLTVLSREIMVIANVALSKGSSQHGNARRAAVGYNPISTLSFQRSAVCVPRTA